MKYNCSQNSEAEVIEESNPKVFRLKKTSNLDLGDRLKADAITILTNQLKPVKPEVIKHSHRHQAMKAIFNKYTFAEIKYPIEQISKAIEKRKGK